MDRLQGINNRPARPGVSERKYQQQPTPGTALGRSVVYREVTHEDNLAIAADGHNLVAVIPAHNEGDSIYNCLESIYEGDMWPDLTFVVANNCSSGDKTVDEVLRFKERYPEFPLALHDVQGLEGRKVGALCYSWEKLEHLHFDYFVSMDGDVILDENCLRDLYDEITEGDRIGGVAARYNFLPASSKGPLDRFWLFYQRVDFAMWTANLLKEPGRETYVLGGQVSMLDADVMRKIADEPGRMYPWSPATAVEDMELTWKINDAGYSTVCSATARAWVGHMPTRAALWGQRMKWDRGIVDLLRDPAMKHSNGPYLKEPKRQQWRSLFDLIIRVLLWTALPLALLRGSYELFEAWWMPVLAVVPVLLSIIIGAITTWITPKRSIGEFLASLVYFPLEGYVWFRTGVWARAWIGALRGEKEDLWAAQSRSEGRGDTSVHSGRAAGRHRGVGSTHRNIDRDELDRDRRRSERRKAKERQVESGQRNRKRGNKHYFRWTLLPVSIVLTVVSLILALKVHEGFWLTTVIGGLITICIALSLLHSVFGDALSKRGKKPLGFRWIAIPLIIAIFFLATLGQQVVYVAWSWGKYLVYLAGTAVDIYLYFAWFSLLGITLVLCTILVIKIFSILALRSKGLKP